ncbi:hypothetical protein BGX20_007430, partial [Mortierella sp. AD010]
IEPEDTVDDLKEAIQKKKSKVFSDVDTDALVLWSAEVADEGIPVNLQDVGPKTLLAKSTKSIKTVFGENPAPETIHCIVERPSAAPSATNFQVPDRQQSLQLSPPSSRPASPS